MNSTKKRRGKKRPKPSPSTEDDEVDRCRYFNSRKKRYCTRTVDGGKPYCSAHEDLMSLVHAVGGSVGQINKKLVGEALITCPLDPNHSLLPWNLEKHLRICNGGQPKKDSTPAYIEKGINASSDGEESEIIIDQKGLKLEHVSREQLQLLIKKVEVIYEETQIGLIEELIMEHEAFKEELANESCGSQMLKHLAKTASLLGILKREQFFKDDVAFVEFGTGKGQVACSLATVLQQENLKNVQIFSVSHPQKNLRTLTNQNVLRLPTDVGDLVLRKVERMKHSKQVVGVGRSLCGEEADLTLRCLIRVNKDRSDEYPLQSEGFLFGLCCYNRCNWNTYVGKTFLREKAISREEFELVLRMVSWAVSGTGSNQDDEDIETQKRSKKKYGLTSTQRKEIGRKCQRVLDWGRIQYLKENGFDAGLKYYTWTDITLDNVCLIGRIK